VLPILAAHNAPNSAGHMLALRVRQPAPVRLATVQQQAGRMERDVCAPWSRQHRHCHAARHIARGPELRKPLVCLRRLPRVRPMQRVNCGHKHFWGCHDRASGAGLSACAPRQVIDAPFPRTSLLRAFEVSAAPWVGSSVSRHAAASGSLTDNFKSWDVVSRGCCPWSFLEHPVTQPGDHDSASPAPSGAPVDTRYRTGVAARTGAHRRAPAPLRGAVRREHPTECAPLCQLALITRLIQLSTSCQCQPSTNNVLHTVAHCHGQSLRVRVRACLREGAVQEQHPHVWRARAAVHTSLLRGGAVTAALVARARARSRRLTAGPSSGAASDGAVRAVLTRVSSDTHQP
jgi:hypothetical protein